MNKRVLIKILSVVMTLITVISCFGVCSFAVNDYDEWMLGSEIFINDVSQGSGYTFTDYNGKDVKIAFYYMKEPGVVDYQPGDIVFYFPGSGFNYSYNEELFTVTSENTTDNLSGSYIKFTNKISIAKEQVFEGKIELTAFGKDITVFGVDTYNESSSSVYEFEMSLNKKVTTSVAFSVNVPKATAKGYTVLPSWNVDTTGIDYINSDKFLNYYYCNVKINSYANENKLRNFQTMCIKLPADLTFDVHVLTSDLKEEIMPDANGFYVIHKNTGWQSNVYNGSTPSFVLVSSQNTPFDVSFYGKYAKNCFTKYVGDNIAESECAFLYTASIYEGNIKLRTSVKTYEVGTPDRYFKTVSIISPANYFGRAYNNKLRTTYNDKILYEIAETNNIYNNIPAVKEVELPFRALDFVSGGKVRLSLEKTETVFEDGFIQENLFKDDITFNTRFSSYDANLTSVSNASGTKTEMPCEFTIPDINGLNFKNNNYATNLNMNISFPVLENIPEGSKFTLYFSIDIVDENNETHTLRVPLEYTVKEGTYNYVIAPEVFAFFDNMQVYDTSDTMCYPVNTNIGPAAEISNNKLFPDIKTKSDNFSLSGCDKITAIENNLETEITVSHTPEYQAEVNYYTINEARELIKFEGNSATIPVLFEPPPANAEEYMDAQTIIDENAYKEAVELREGIPYSYKIRIFTYKDMTDIVIYDNLEKNSEEGNEKGIFNGINTSYLNNKGYITKIYYNTNTNAGPLSTDTSWRELTEETDKETVKSVAIKILNSDGSPATVPGGSYITASINMIAPDVHLVNKSKNVFNLSWRRTTEDTPINIISNELETFINVNSPEENGSILTVNFLNCDEEFLPGASLQMYNEDGDLVTEWNTEDEAQVISKLPVGTYKIVETVKPENYLPMKTNVIPEEGEDEAEYFEVIIAENNKDYEVSIYSDKMSFELPDTGSSEIIFMTVMTALAILMAFMMDEDKRKCFKIK